jgi:UDP-N-acetylmuramoyl-tripeptide--D-alanyl-D-alanine ligase
MIKKTLKSIVIFLLKKEAQAVLRKYRPKIVAVTGSVGKTSTKDAIHTALSRFYSCRTSKKSFNTDIGIPLTILDVPNASSNFFGWIRNLWDGLALILLPSFYPDWLVLEVGADAPGDIQKITEWLKPDIVVVTRLAKVPVHVEFFASPEDLFNEKAHLVRALKREGTLILNADDEDVLALRSLTESKTVLFGSASGADISAARYQIVYGANKLAEGIAFDVVSGKETYPITLSGTVGEHHTYHILAALAVCKSLNESISEAAKAFKHHEPTPGRMRLVQGLKQTIIIDDSYNSSPVALEEALKTLAGVKAKRRIAVLGDMLDLGKYSIDEHKKAGQIAAKVAKILITVGVRSRYMAESALDAGMKEDNVFQFDESREAGAFLQNMMKAGDAILVKGSQSGIRMERVVEEIMAHPEDKEKLLVRQDEEWVNRP